MVVHQDGKQASDSGSSGVPTVLRQAGKGHAMTTRLLIDDQPDQNAAPGHGSAEG